MENSGINETPIFADPRRLGEILQDPMFNVSKSIIEEALAVQATLASMKNPIKKRIGEVLVDSGMVGRDKVYSALACQKGIRYVPSNTIKAQANFKMHRNPILVEALGGMRNVSEFLNNIFRSECVPTHFMKINDERVLTLVRTNPNSDKQTPIKQLTMMLDKKIKYQVVMSDSSIFTEFKLKYNAITKEELEFFSRNIDIESSFNVDVSRKITIDQFLQYLLCFAVLERASDIHILPNSDGLVRVAMRIMGVIETLFYISYPTYNRLMRKVKSVCGMKETITTIPQDGRIDGSSVIHDVEIFLNREDAIKDTRYNVDENYMKYDFSKVSFRISTYPTEPINSDFDIGNSFESLVIRVLNLSQGYTELGELGLSAQAVNYLDSYKNRTQGIIIIVGPTGSGKSTTLYSLLSSINCLEKKVITFEDPVEMRQLFWAQGQRRIVENNKEMNFDFNEATKSILRQDPNNIMMAEVRDKPTADFAISSANTGHLVVTTLHANSAASAIERLKKLGVQSLDIGTSVLCIMGQRIVRKLCTHCRQKRALNPREENELLAMELPKDRLPKEIHVRSEEGCEYCNGKGYIGAVVINEIIPFNRELRQIIVNNGSEIEIRNKADEGEFKTMLEDGIEKSIVGTCDINDVLRAL